MAARILVIEDNPSLLALYSDLFEDEGYEVILQPTPQLDPATITRVTPDLIVLDLLFDGDLTGWETLQGLKLQPATATIPVVICSAATKSIEELQDSFTTMGAHFLKKPFDLETLLDVVRHLLNNNAALPHPLTS
ncbi:MAG TPA: response regulator [Herpetosiphonaceae bacterium]